MHFIITHHSIFNIIALSNLWECNITLALDYYKYNTEYFQITVSKSYKMLPLLFRSRFFT